MLKRSAIVVAIGLALILTYLLTWPVPVSPVAWDAPRNAGLVDPFESNDRLAKAAIIDLGVHESPEDVTGRDGYVFASTLGGRIIRLRPDGTDLTVFAETGGRPLGIEFDSDGRLIVANSQLGLQSSIGRMER